MKARSVGSHRLLIVDGCESHQSFEFQDLYNGEKIHVLCMPSHSLNLLQPLNVVCFHCWSGHTAMRPQPRHDTVSTELSTNNMIFILTTRVGVHRLTVSIFGQERERSARALFDGRHVASLIGSRQAMHAMHK